MIFVSFNINGLRARIHQLKEIITRLHPDVIGLQETKVHDNMFPVNEILSYGYNVYYHGQKSHYGVALLSRKKPLEIRRGFCTDNNQSQKRIIMADFITKKGLLTVINGYFPHGENRNHPIKFPAKEFFFQNLQKYVEKNHNSGKSLLIIMGDMNVCFTDLDIGIEEKNSNRWLSIGKCSFLYEERIWVKRLLDWGMIDTYRKMNPTNNDYYSWFDYRSRCFNNNLGLRIDFLLASLPLSTMIKNTGIDYNIRAMNNPSDHAPVWTDFNL
ncbi:Exodeoxyribonuclease III [secondary endosymbiont of Trabutina mannipara]|uniref:Exodeoxyribonuclease III n=1 Tax=secondary endosymbiont of Trabutina mannipara TaxID=1835721 RepID=A0A1C3L3P1_9ENTR|nr:exodeoxyribonuclease III [secondary endosymbiont of Trabutina mannipara]SBT81902.1 Exodeoxyribonuclease III [secondary endosymbiont of Trabutina mannipara]